MSRPCGQPRFTRALVGSSDMRRPHVENARTYSEHTHRKSPPNLSVCDRLHAPAPRTAHPQVAVTHIGHLGNPPPPTPVCLLASVGEKHGWSLAQPVRFSLLHPLLFRLQECRETLQSDQKCPLSPHRSTDSFGFIVSRSVFVVGTTAG